MIINRDKVRATIIVLLVLALGFAIINQATGFFFKAQLLRTPCNLCKDSNPGQSKCIDACFEYENKSYFLDGEWVPDSLDKINKINLSLDLHYLN